MPRFVILEHDHPVRHWDLMLQMGEVLRTWRLEKPPMVDVPIAAAASFDHRLMYLDYQGPISGNRGSVTRWEGGCYEIERQSEGNLIFKVFGERLIGKIELRLEGNQQWIFQFAVAQE